MAPYSKASEVQQVSTSDGGVRVYRGRADPYWAHALLSGGYLVGIIIRACADYQSSAVHKDPIHISAHFFSAATSNPPDLEVHVKLIRAGKGFSNLSAELIQQGTLRVTAHLVFGVLDPGPNPPADPAYAPLYPPEPQARTTPFRQPPSRCTAIPLPSLLKFGPYVLWAKDPTVEARHARLNAAGDGDGGFEDGRWFTLRDADDVVTTALLPFLADLHPGLLHDARGFAPGVFPTVAMTVEFKAPIPRGEAKTIGAYGSSRFVNHPQGRHGLDIEVWTAPDDIGGTPTRDENWREKQRCLLVAHHMTLAVPLKPRGKTSGRNKTPKNKL
ncbi:thioesterase-like superfamily-domain-containing protein [Gloeopeniophorella convolvens]|nr:thioesterase-like superfamily-domain-containing protein [Gloeopeniophorella convolvens]